MGLSRASLISLPLIIALALRLYPSLMSQLPFSTDSWPLIRNAEVLLEHTPVNLEEEIFDGYNNYWPSSSIFGAVVSLVTGSSPMAAMALGIPAAAALAIPLFYTLTCRFYGKISPAFIASIILATSFPYALSTAGAIKETYASPLLMLLVLIVLSSWGWRGAALFAISSATLAMTHHLTSVVALAALAFMMLSDSLKRFLRGTVLERLRPTLTFMLATSIALHFLLYAYRGFKVTLTLNDFITVISYQVVAFAFALYVARSSEGGIGSWRGIKCFLAAAIPTVVLTLCTFRRITPDAPMLPRRYIIYGLPFAASAPLALIGFWELKKAGGGYAKLEPLFWLASVLGFEIYAVFGGPPVGLTLAYRMINFMWPPLAMLCGYGVYRLLSAGRLAAKIFSATSIVLMAVLGCYSSYAATIVGERYMGYFWLYRAQEFRAGVWISSLYNNRTVFGDVKYAYLLRGYFEVKYNEFQGLLYLSGLDKSKPSILITYDLMGRNGYVIYSGYSVDLPLGWVKRLHNLSLIYLNGVVNIYLGD